MYSKHSFIVATAFKGMLFRKIRRTFFYRSWVGHYRKYEDH